MPYTLPWSQESLHKNYQGGDIALPDDPEIVITEDAYPNLKKKLGHDLITASGKTLLGADDKAGIAELLEAIRGAEQYPPLEIVVSREEEIGLKGSKNIDVSLLIDSNFTLSIKDYGTGFDTTRIESSEGLGIAGMKERAVLSGGKLTVESIIDKGTTVTFTVDSLFDV